MDDTRREHLRRLIRDAFGNDRARFGRRVGLSKGRISQLLTAGEVFGERAAKNLVKKLGLAAGYFERPLPPDTDAALADDISHNRVEEMITPYRSTSPQLRGGAAHLPILPPDSVTPSHNWGDIVPTATPEVFSVALPDDSMAPPLPAGSIITFRAATQASSGDLILLSDKDGTLYFREYRERTPTAWRAVAKNPAFLDLDSAGDGLTVLALMVRRSVEGSRL